MKFSSHVRNGLTSIVLSLACLLPAQAQSVSGQGTWETTLQARDIGNTGITNAFFDTALNITWLDFTKTGGTVDSGTASAWANSLSVGGLSGWRLPSSSEMDHLLLVSLGNIAYYDANGQGPQAGYGFSNKGNFQNFYGAIAYWRADPGGSYAYSWPFPQMNGGPYSDPVTEQPLWLLLATAVHEGDVALVPEPETYAMLLTGLALIGAVVRRRKWEPE